MTDDGSQGFVPLDSIQKAIETSNYIFSGAANLLGKVLIHFFEYISLG